jgi:hypothetical protein
MSYRIDWPTALLTLATLLSSQPARAACSTDTAASDFTAGTPGSCYFAQVTDGEVLLSPTEGTEFSGVAMPAGWNSFTWDPSGTVTLGGGVVTVDAAVARTDANYGPGRSLEFVATFGTHAFQHAGFGNVDDAASNQMFANPPWAIFTTKDDGAQVRARVANGGPLVDVDVGFACANGTCLGEPHRYRIDWTASEIDFFIDGVAVHSETGRSLIDVYQAVTQMTDEICRIRAGHAASPDRTRGQGPRSFPAVVRRAAA